MTKTASWILLLFVVLASCAWRQPDPRTAPAARHAAAPRAAAMRTITVSAALRELHGPHPPKILQVGFQVLFKGGHIPGAIYAGPASSAAGLRRLRRLARNWPRATRLLIYCGCCPFRMCPNIRPAYALLQRMGFGRLQALYLPHSLARDWIQKGLPTQRQR